MPRSFPAAGPPPCRSAAPVPRQRRAAFPRTVEPVRDRIERGALVHRHDAPGGKLVDGERRPRQRDAQPVRGGVEHEVVVLEAPVLGTRTIVHAARRNQARQADASESWISGYFSSRSGLPPPISAASFGDATGKQCSSNSCTDIRPGILPRPQRIERSSPSSARIGLVVVDVEHDAQRRRPAFQRALAAASATAR